MTYHVTRHPRGWLVSTKHDDGGTTDINVYGTKNAAITVARILAGWRHQVVVH